MVESVRDFLDELNKYPQKKNTYYRGHSDSRYELVPTIYRKDNKTGRRELLANEDKLYREVIARLPSDFANKNTLESLVYMQHYDIPTRLLDITENPLIALYFTCKNSNEKSLSDGEVVIINVDDEDINHYNSDKVTILSNLAKCNFNLKYDDYMFSYWLRQKQSVEGIMEKHKSFDINAEYLGQAFEFLNLNGFFLKDKDINFLSDLNSWQAHLHASFREVLLYLKPLGVTKLNNSVTRMIVYYTYENILRLINERIFDEKKQLSTGDLFMLLNNIRDDKPFFEAQINPFDVSKTLVVKPKLDNPRIVKQQGAFLIFGAGKENKSLVNLDKNFEVNRIFIPKDAKNLILKELKTFGIDQVTLFPEIEYVAKYVKEKFTGI